MNVMMINSSSMDEVSSMLLLRSSVTYGIDASNFSLLVLVICVIFMGIFSSLVLASLMMMRSRIKRVIARMRYNILLFIFECCENALRYNKRSSGDMEVEVSIICIDLLSMLFL